ncbi:MAG TPA: cyclic nucleotide-binding domain-containing protein [Clostridiales bacterium]|nr:cyclic nucleotide-binding domain-containing protein [Clostridiales bacterium]
MKLLKINKDHRDFLAANGLGFVDTECVLPRAYEKGEYLFHQGEQLSCIYLLYSGKVSISVTAKNGKTLLLAICTNQTIFGEIEFFTDGLATSSAQAMNRALLLTIPFAQLRDVEGNEKLLYFLGLTLAKKLTRSIQNNTTNILNLADAKVASYILLSNVDGRFKANLTKVAELLGISYRHLLRTLEELCTQGILAKDRHAFVIRDIDGLRALAQDCFVSMDIRLN